jgi:transcriptional regulator with XRE-family HTH domain
MGVPENLEQQRMLYGEPLGDLIRRAAAPLGLRQARVAELLGLSPAMLSHLMTGHRVKIANPAALARLRALLELGAAAPGLTTGEVALRLDEIRSLSAELTTTQTAAPTGPGAVRALLRAVASGREIEAAAAAVSEIAPDLATALRIYGTGSDEEARAHYAAIEHLL